MVKKNGHPLFPSYSKIILSWYIFSNTLALSHPIHLPPLFQISSRDVLQTPKKFLSSLPIDLMPSYLLPSIFDPNISLLQLLLLLSGYQGGVSRFKIGMWHRRNRWGWPATRRNAGLVPRAVNSKDDTGDGSPSLVLLQLQPQGLDPERA